MYGIAGYCATGHTGARRQRAVSVTGITAANLQHISLQPVMGAFGAVDNLITARLQALHYLWFQIEFRFIRGIADIDINSALLWLYRVEENRAAHFGLHI